MTALNFTIAHRVNTNVPGAAPNEVGDCTLKGNSVVIAVVMVGGTFMDTAP